MTFSGKTALVTGAAGVAQRRMAGARVAVGGWGPSS